MGTKHNHYDVIVAWAAGEEVEIKDADDDKVWVSFTNANAKYVMFYEDMEYRIKPKRVIKEGWIVPMCSGQYAVFPTNEMAARSIKHRKDLKPIRIEWEEEE